VPFSNITIVSAFPHWSPSCLKNGQVVNRTRTRTNRSSSPTWRQWNIGITTSRKQIIKSSYNATMRTSSTSKCHKCSPGGSLNLRRFSLHYQPKVKLISENRPQAQILLHVVHKYSERLIFNPSPSFEVFNDVIALSQHLKNVFSQLILFIGLVSSMLVL